MPFSYQEEDFLRNVGSKYLQLILIYTILSFAHFFLCIRSFFSQRKLILLDDLPSTSKISKRLQQNAASEQYKGHFVNKYTLMYFEKERYKAEVDRLKSIIEEQKQTIGKLIVNSEIVLIDTETQTDTPIFDDVGIQTGEC